MFEATSQGFGRAAKQRAYQRGIVMNMQEWISGLDNPPD